MSEQIVLLFWACDERYSRLPSTHSMWWQVLAWNNNSYLNSEAAYHIKLWFSTQAIMIKQLEHTKIRGDMWLTFEALIAQTLPQKFASQTLRIALSGWIELCTLHAGLMCDWLQVHACLQGQLLIGSDLHTSDCAKPTLFCIIYKLLFTMLCIARYMLIHDWL